MAECVALIPARGGSQRIPRKNIRKFLGVPALARLVKTLQNSHTFDAIYVSTDDSEIAAVAREAGATIPFMRPASLADNFTGARPVIQHAVNALQLNQECTVGVFYPTAVLLEPQDVTDSLTIFRQSDVDFVLSVAEFSAPISRALTMDETGSVAPIQQQFQAHRTQDLRRTYHDLGQFYWGAVASWVGDKSVVESESYGYLIDSWRAVDIDTPEDWLHAEIMHRVLNATK